jgi:hypothetical protein
MCIFLHTHTHTHTHTQSSPYSGQKEAPCPCLRTHQFLRTLCLVVLQSRFVYFCVQFTTTRVRVLCEVDIQYAVVFTSSVTVRHRQRWKNIDSVFQPSQPKQSGIQLSPSTVSREWIIQKQLQRTRFRITP